MRKRNRTATPCGNLRGGELGDGLGALRDGVLGELAGEDEAHRGLDLPGGDGGLLVLLEDVVDERVHDGHGLGGDTNVRVHLLEDLEDIDLVGLDALLGLLLAALLAGARHALLSLRLLLGLLLCRLPLGGLLLGFGRHHGNGRME
ncbi:hypothetical protein PVAP13_5NG583501 [Panicum virgatum]|uniref:Uncharacterized protein n=1 Tax=Panicum virgatum TaxID=38727 RepID=A0A8T0S8P9_PANVG|nr:hypothetical protein PVAP13_5NG583501 [Panicum virgatum]